MSDKTKGCLGTLLLGLIGGAVLRGIGTGFVSYPLITIGILAGLVIVGLLMKGAQDGGELAQRVGQHVAREREGFRRLKRGLQAADVRSILGEPARVGADAATTVWEYSSGSVSFDASGAVSGWQER